MKHYTIIINILIFLFAFSSCKDDDELSIELEQDTYEVPGLGGYVDIEVKANAPLAISKTASWIKEDNSRSNLFPLSIRLYVEPNETGKERTAEVVLLNITSRSVKIRQRALIPKGILSVVYEGMTIKVPVFNIKADGFVSWENETFEAYRPDLTFDFQENENIVTFEMEQVESVHFENIEGVNAIDFSYF